jgi:hypothetical protein
MRTHLICLSAAFCWLSALTSSQATDFSLTTTIGGAFDLNFNPITHEEALVSTEPVIWKVDLAVLTENLSSGDAGFANLGFSVEFENSADAFNMGWQPYNPTVQLNGAGIASSLPKFFMNSDVGGKGDDEKGILVSIAHGITDANDPRIVQAGLPLSIGSLFVQDIPTAASSIKINPVMFSPIRSDGSFGESRYAGGNNVMQLPRSTGGPSTFDISTIHAPIVPPMHKPVAPSIHEVPIHEVPGTPPVVTTAPHETPTPPPAPWKARPLGANANFSLSTTIGGAFDLNFNPISHEQALASTEPVIWKVDFSVATDSSHPERVGFGNVAFSIKLDGASDAMNLGWQAHNPVTENANGLGSTSQFFINMDAGPSAQDEQGILVSLAGRITDPNDPRRALGQTPGSPDLIGSMFIQDVAQGVSSLTVERVAFAANDGNGNFYQAKDAYGQSTMNLPRSSEGLAALNVSTANSPPPAPVPPVIESPAIDPDPVVEPELPIDPPLLSEPEVEHPTETPINEEPVVDPAETPLVIDIPNIPVIRWPIIDTREIVVGYDPELTIIEVNEFLAGRGTLVAWDGVDSDGVLPVKLRGVLTSYGIADAAVGMAFTQGNSLDADRQAVPEPCGAALLAAFALGGILARGRH